MFRRNIAALPSTVFLLVALSITKETLASVTDEFSSSTSTEIDSTGSSEATIEIDSSSVEDVETTTTPYTTTEIPNHQEEPKLPVDLLSEDILLDPNVVLARLARDTRDYNSEYFYRRPLRRTQNERSDFYTNPEPTRRNYAEQKLPIYPVFPGKK